MFDQSVVLITGGTGSFGKAFAKHILNRYNPERILIYSRDELKQSEMSREEPFCDSDRMRYFIGDIRDKERLFFAMGADVNIVVHAAALKQVPASEYNPFEAVKTNILGSQNVIDGAMSVGVQKVMALSTDKAAAPINVYGATKLTADKLFIAANNYKSWEGPAFSVVRYGNVLGSRGSVAPFFLTCRQSRQLPITDKRMTRFNITLSEGVRFVERCVKEMCGGELFVPKLPSFYITDLAKAIAPGKEYSVVGLREGEKLHEEMITISDSRNTAEFEDYFVIMPNSQYLKWDQEEFLVKDRKQSGRMCPADFSYRSDSNQLFLSVEQLRQLVVEHVEGGHVLVGEGG